MNVPARLDMYGWCIGGFLFLHLVFWSDNNYYKIQYNSLSQLAFVVQLASLSCVWS